ncbi:inner membrane transporter RhtA [Nakamurella flavida]|uniref:EamA family transporter n=1 Tax=Nakamurella flavida TaxID=363630 RepID=UPI00278A3B2A|nr:EamA family transporter [Nakamurella flavida]MDP9779387.1 inner membrane transporter RhtA [Nakamurella flavida]
MPRSRPTGAIPAPVLFLVSGFTQYYGAALAIGLFAVIPAVSVAWWRLAVSALVLLAWRRPWRLGWSRRELAGSAVFGIVLATMNVSFYLALSHLPLGTAVALEFLGPVGVAAMTGRHWRERLGIVLAASGVVLLAGVSLETGSGTGTLIGLAAIAVSAITWAGYIVLGRRIAGVRNGVDSLAVGMTAGAIVWSPLVVFGWDGVRADPRRLLVLLGIALLSSVVPYVLEQLVLRRTAAARFAILLALLPVTAAITGAFALQQIPSAAEVVGIAAICGAIVLSGRGSRPDPALP